MHTVRRFLIATIAILLAPLSACRPPTATEVQAGCEIVEAFEPDAASVCAYAPELAAIASEILAKRTARDAGADASIRSSLPCVYIQKTDVCATNAERAAGVRSILAQRKGK